jgi:hypothetical protein
MGLRSDSPFSHTILVHGFKSPILIDCTVPYVFTGISDTFSILSVHSDPDPGM